MHFSPQCEAASRRHDDLGRGDGLTAVGGDGVALHDARVVHLELVEAGKAFKLKRRCISVKQYIVLITKKSQLFPCARCVEFSLLDVRTVLQLNPF